MLNTTEIQFSKAMQMIALGDFHAAFECLYRCNPLTPPINPKILSYYGFCLAKVYNKLDEGLQIARNALIEDHHDPELYLNLAMIYLLRDDSGSATKMNGRSWIELESGS